MPELPAMAVTQRFRHVGDQLQPRRTDADVHNTPVVRQPLALDQAQLLQPIDHARDVRGARDEPAGQIERRQLARLGCTQEAQHVVLLRREAVAGEQLLLDLPQPVVGAPEVQKNLLLGRIEAGSGQRSACPHDSDYRPPDNTCPDNCLNNHYPASPAGVSPRGHVAPNSTIPQAYRLAPPPSPQPPPSLESRHITPFAARFPCAPASPCSRSPAAPPSCTPASQKPIASSAATRAAPPSSMPRARSSGNIVSAL